MWRRLTCDESVTAVIMFVLALAIIDGKDQPLGVPQFLHNSWGISADWFAVIMANAAAALFYLKVIRKEDVPPLHFLVLTAPLLFFVAAFAAYVFLRPQSSKAGLVLAIGLYSLLTLRARRIIYQKFGARVFVSKDKPDEQHP